MYPSLYAAMDALSSREFKVVAPDMQRHAQYEVLYEKYKQLRKYFSENK